MKKRIVYIVACLLALTACSDDFTETDGALSIVVDGYIEAGSCAKIILTRPIEPTADIDSSKYLEIVNTRAKVVLSDGEQTEVLSLTRDNTQFPPHYYKSSTIKGEVGKVYTLKIIYNGDTVSSQTTIPLGFKIDSLWTVPSETDSLRKYLWTAFQENPLEENYYRFFTMVKGVQTRFFSTYLSAQNDKNTNGQYIKLPLYKGLESFIEKNQSECFSVGDTVIVKTCTMDSQSYAFWKNYEKEVFNSGNPFVVSGSNLTSNIQGGIGVWCGYNSQLDTIIIR